MTKEEEKRLNNKADELADIIIGLEKNSVERQNVMDEFMDVMRTLYLKD